METRTRDMLFGTGRGQGDLRGTFAPRGMAAAEGEKGSILSTFKGFGSSGKGREKGLELMERFGLISSEQRAANGPVADAAAGQVRGLMGAEGGAAAAVTGAGQAAEYANPVYHGVYAQMLMQQTGFVPPLASAEPAATRTLMEVAPEGAAAAASEVAGGPSAAIADAAAQGADDLASLEIRLVEAFQRLADLPDEQKLATVARAVDATADAGHGAGSFAVLGEAIASRPLDVAIQAINESVDHTLQAAAPVADDVAKAATPLADEVAKVVAPASEALAHAAAPVADDAAKVVAAATPEVVEAAVPKVVDAIVPRVVEAAVPKVVEAAVPKVVEAAVPALAHSGSTRSLLIGASDALHGVMPFAAGVDDTLRLLSHIR
ncbi:MAG: hypothetical protein KDC46_11525 [Thermoleophilia bacterium]|nr:hypothetical protein [Thermoleophilia bacterium]